VSETTTRTTGDAAVARFTIGELTFAVIPAAATAGSGGDTDAQELTRFSADGVIYAVIGEASSRRKAAASLPLLTARELQIATLVAQGLVNKQVADRLRISEWTVCTHLRRIYSKLGVSTRSAMVFRCAAFVIDPAAQ
jgi:DNA-binding CsgD family transcriptional regulator